MKRQRSGDSQTDAGEATMNRARLSEPPLENGYHEVAHADPDRAQLQRLLDDSVLLYQGAEARLFLVALSPWRLGVLKQRLRKPHIHPSLDFKLHVHRMQQEVRAMARCRKAGVDAPQVFWVRLPARAFGARPNTSSKAEATAGSVGRGGVEARDPEGGLILMEWLESVAVKAVLHELEDPEKKSIASAQTQKPRHAESHAATKASDRRPAQKDATEAPRSGEESENARDPDAPAGAKRKEKRMQHERKQNTKRQEERKNETVAGGDFEDFLEDEPESDEDVAPENSCACGVWEEKAIERLGRAVGRAVARMHNASLVHGDLTTSNLLLRSAASSAAPSSSLCATWPAPPRCTLGRLEAAAAPPQETSAACVVAVAEALHAPIAAAAAQAAAEACAETTVEGLSVEATLRRRVGKALQQVAAQEARALLAAVGTQEEEKAAGSKGGEADRSAEETGKKKQGKEENLPAVSIIDFGLASTSTLPEDRAVDLFVLERAVHSTHFSVSTPFLAAVLAAYERYAQGAAQTLARLDAVRMRGRKRLMIG
ncbi:putative protein kinase [Besnoitia besnoiti]|uniref:non-specific serine/threonine protein kinase n=1 Tax=Besnoitia besnoiti TaxID=94643 RepID=A0A2A9M7F6_BESBE|nr:putative protein kinase [Besnoitia besnoiti]PFH31302.1 putative protein kinase [Besnoitia besnoiti]